MIQIRFINCTDKQLQNINFDLSDNLSKITIFEIVCKIIQNKSFRSYNDIMKK